LPDGTCHSLTVLSPLAEARTFPCRSKPMQLTPLSWPVQLAGGDGSVALWSPAASRPTKRLWGGKNLSSVAYHPGGQILASATFDEPGEVVLWDVERAKAVGHFRGHTSRITGLTYSTDGRLLASSSHDGTVRLLDGRSGEQVLLFTGHTFAVSAVAFSPYGRLVASAGGRLQAALPEEGEVLIWRADTGDVLHALRGHSRRPTALTFSPDGRRLATAGWDREIKLWDVQTGQEVLALIGHQDGVMSIAFSPDGQYLASGGMDRTVRLWGPSGARWAERKTPKEEQESK
jgi:WD40 repeat protein